MCGCEARDRIRIVQAWSDEVEYNQKKMETNVENFLMVETGL